MIIITEKKLEEQLVPANKQEFDRLKAEIDQNQNLKRQLTSPVGQMPQYSHLFRGWGIFSDSPMISILENFCTDGKIKLFFSKAGNTFTGFVAYREEGRIIRHIKIASFFDDQSKANRTIANDLRNFITTEMPTHSKIEWEVEFDNKKAIELYQKAIPKWFPQYRLQWEWSDKVGRWVYTLTKS